MNNGINADFINVNDRSIHYGDGLFETILGQEDAVISDTLNHASIIDGIRLCKAKRYRYKNNDMSELEARLIEADEDGARQGAGRGGGVRRGDDPVRQGAPDLPRWRRAGAGQRRDP